MRSWWPETFRLPASTRVNPGLACLILWKVVRPKRNPSRLNYDQATESLHLARFALAVLIVEELQIFPWFVVVHAA